MSGDPDDGNELARLIGPCWTERRTLDALSISFWTLERLQASGTILALPTNDGGLVYPTAQFRRHGGKFEVQPGLELFFAALRAYDPWAVAVLMHTPAPELDEETPIAWSSRGGPTEPLAQLAKAASREWAAGSAPS